MPTYVAFLRAINLASKRKFPASEIRRCLDAAGYDDVATHINSGNVRLTTSERKRSALETDLEDLFLADRGFEVTTVAFTTADFAAVADDTLAIAAEYKPGRHYVSLMRDAPSRKVAAEAESSAPDQIKLIVRGRALHYLVAADHPTGGVDITKAERIFGKMTNRNANVVTTIADKWCR